MALLEIESITKRYDSIIATDHISFAIERGTIHGLVGPNGAGKTTTIRMILGILQPDEGVVRFEGVPFQESTRNLVGYVPEERGLYRKQRVHETIVYFSTLRGMTRSSANQEADLWLKKFDLLASKNRKIEELSKGNQQKVQFINAVINRPKLLMLDEPFSGLDPVNQEMLTDLLLELRRSGTAIVLSTHQMDQAEKLTDPLTMIDRGKIVLSGPLKDIKAKYGTNSIALSFDGNGDLLKEFQGISSIQLFENSVELKLTDQNRSQQFLTFAASKVQINKFEIVQPSLNSIFLDIVGATKEIRA